jgi:predicted methyltransferase
MSGCYPSGYLGSFCDCICHKMNYHPCCICDCNKPGTYKMYSKDFLDWKFKTNNDDIKNIILRIEKLEELNQKCFDNNPLKIIEDRFRDIEEKQKQYIDTVIELRLKINKIRSEYDMGFMNSKNKPHKCPVCDGEGSQLKEIHEKIAEFERLPSKLAITCNACQGKGILWR